jgi:hypothetical protein
MEALSLAANILSIIHIATEVIARINEFKNTIDGVPKTLQALANELPTLSLVLKKIHAATLEGRIPEDSAEALEPLIKNFGEQIQAVLGIIEKMRPRDSSRMARNIKAMTSFKYDGEIKYHESVIRGYASTLSLERVVSGPGKDLAGMFLPYGLL